MTLSPFCETQIGDVWPPLLLPPIDRAQLALFAGASGDHNPMHIDSDFARRHGAPDVFAQGMLGMAWLGRAVTGWVPQSQLRELHVRFVGILQLGDAITCKGTVVEKSQRAAESRVHLDILASDSTGNIKIAGRALIALA
jgi:acyl dehydratase